LGKFSTLNNFFQFVCSKNIALFLKACRDNFSINEVFSEDDLLELQNFPAVLRLLSQLSRSQKSRQLGLKFFFIFVLKNFLGIL